MPSKLLGVLTTSSSQITVERTDVGGPSGPHLISLADGDWFMRATGVAIVTTPAGPVNTITVSVGHKILAGHTIDVWDVSGDVALATSRLVTAAGSTSITFDGAAITVASGDTVFVSDDLVGYVIARVRGQDVSNLDGFTVTVDSDGVVSIGMGAGEDLTVTWTTTDVRDWWRYSGTVSVSGTTETPDPDTPHVGGVYLGKDVESDLDQDEPVYSQARAIGGQVETCYRAQWALRTIRFQAAGPPRSTDATKMAAVKDFFATHVGRGRRWCYYCDSTITVPYVARTAARGYETLVCVGDLAHKPQQVAAGFVNYFRYEVLAQTYVA